MRVASGAVAAAFIAALTAVAAAQTGSPSPSPEPTQSVAPTPTAATSSASPAPTAQPAATPTPVPTPRDTATVTPPAGWESGTRVESGPFMILHLWHAPAAKKRPDNVVLGYVALGSAQGAGTEAYGKAVASAVSKMGPPGNVKASKPIKICHGTQQGWYLEDVLNFGSLKVRQESVLAAGPHEGFMAAYTRKDGDKPIAAARAAIKTLCVK